MSLAVLLALSGCGRPDVSGAAPADAAPTFTADIAPIVFENCAPCHHPGGPGPFSLLTYNDVRRRAEQIAEVTERRYMPPWLPEPADAELLGERRLSDRQIGTIRTWVDQGGPEGSPDGLPPLPEFAEGWQLGEPDLVVRMDDVYTLPAEGTDIFRNFVFTIPADEPRYVRSVEILPGNRRIVHHANIVIDRTGTSRRRDAQDPEPGFAGMDVEIESERFDPDSHFLFWKPGTPPVPGDPEMAWRLERGTDVVLNMHLQPSGKPEPIQPAVGLYFTDRAPTKFPMLLQLEHDGAIDIPPGVEDFTITDHYDLPVDVEVLGVYPHAHYLGKRIEGFATLPDGARRWLIRIPDWDFNWQAVYPFKRPLFLPKGARISMRIAYDNSANNPRNPHAPPARVRAGNRSSDEMGHLWVQILPRYRDDRLVLQEALMRRRLEKYPGDFVAHANLGAVLQSMGRLEEAVAHLREAVRVRPEDATARNSLGAALQAAGRPDAAIAHFREALRIRPDYVHARYNLGNALLAAGQTGEARAHFRQVLRANPDDTDAHNDLGSALAMQGRLAEAAKHFERALDIDPGHAYANNNLGHVLVQQGQLARAVTHYERALRTRPEDPDILNDLGTALAGLGRLDEAAIHFERALRLDPGHADARANLERARALQQGKR